MKEGIFNQIERIKTVLKSCFNDLKAIYSPLNFYNPLISKYPKHYGQLQIYSIAVFVQTCKF